MKNLKDRLILSLDISEEEKLLKLVNDLKNDVGYFKIGLEIISSLGIDIIKKLKDMGVKIFFDGKFHDIPNTVAAASRNLTRLGVDMFNLHLLGGKEMIKSSIKASVDEATKIGIKHPLILGVTILTSIDQCMLEEQLGIDKKLEDLVLHLAKLAEESGLDGVISSPKEIKILRKNLKNEMLIVTPGIRPKWAQLNDQKRVMTPHEALRSGAAFIVVGRPIIYPPPEIGSPKEAVLKIKEEIENLE